MHSGSKAGLWHNWETGEKGRGLISLYMCTMNVSWKEAIKELGQGYSIDGLNKIDCKKIIPSKELPVIQSDEKQKMAFALKEYCKGTPIKETLAERYLRQHRGIQGAIPDNFKFRDDLKHPDTKKLTQPY